MLKKIGPDVWHSRAWKTVQNRQWM